MRTAEQVASDTYREMMTGVCRHGQSVQTAARCPWCEIDGLKQERYRLRSALGYIVGLSDDSGREAKEVARRVLDSTAPSG